MHGLPAALLAFLLVGGLASAWLLGYRLRRVDQAAGLAALAGMHWREFQRLVVKALQPRGYLLPPTVDAPIDADLVQLRRGDERWLLQTKHGAGYSAGAATIGELGRSVHLHGAHGALLTTLGRADGELVSLARLHRIELLDGRTLWREIRPVLEPAQREAIVGGPRREAIRATALAWVGAAALGLAVFLLRGATPDPAPEPTAPAVSAPAPDTTGAAAGPSAAPAVQVPSDPQEARRALATAVASLPWVERAAWSTPSNLSIDLAAAAQVDKPALCALVAPYRDLRASRLQLNPARGSDQPVRFIQCFGY